MNKQARIASRQRAQGGFTLIELIVVIVILGILAATALPKFSDLSGNARAASLSAAAGALRSASAMVHGQTLINGTASTQASTVALEGRTITTSWGYPAADATLAVAAGVDNVNDYRVIVGPAAAGAAGTGLPAVAANTVAIQPANTTNAACVITYLAPTASGGVPTITSSGAVAANCQ